jgi:hypothetical protein
MYRRLISQWFVCHDARQDQWPSAIVNASTSLNALPTASTGTPWDLPVLPTRVPYRQKFHSFLCFDVEASCSDAKKDYDYPNEIIVRLTFLWLCVYSQLCADTALLTSSPHRNSLSSWSASTRRISSTLWIHSTRMSGLLGRLSWGHFVRPSRASHR